MLVLCVQYHAVIGHSGEGGSVIIVLYLTLQYRSLPKPFCDKKPECAICSVSSYSMVLLSSVRYALASITVRIESVSVRVGIHNHTVRIDNVSLTY